MNSEFALVLALAAFGVIFALPMLILPKIISPKKPSAVKMAPFECGQVPVGEGKFHFMMQYYAYLLMFVVFDVMSVFLYAWGVSQVGIGWQATLVVTGFLAIMFVSLGYAMHLAGRREIW